MNMKIKKKGFGFSDAASKPGMNPKAVATIFRDLMLKLNYSRFVVQGENEKNKNSKNTFLIFFQKKKGGDWGSMIVTQMALQYPENVAAVHVNI